MSDPVLIDTHAHVNFNAYKEDADAVLRRALETGVWTVNVGSQSSTSQRAVEIAGQYDEGVCAVVGLHPIHLVKQLVDEEEFSFETREEIFDYDFYKKLSSYPKVVGIGECGLDYYRLPGGREEETKRKQYETFVQHIELASELKKTLMVHSRDAYNDIYAVLKPRMAKLKSAIIHSFIGNWEEEKKFLDLGCFVSFNGIITYKPRKEKKPGSSDPGLLDAVRQTPLNRILLETDSPYLAPDPLRGTRNEPTNVRHIAEKIAELQNLFYTDVASQTTANARAVFGI